MQTPPRVQVFFALLILSVVGALSVGYSIGIVAAEFKWKDRHFGREKEAILAAIASVPAFADIEIIMYTGNGSAYLQGEVQTEAELERLRALVLDALRASREVDPTDSVWVASP